MNTLLEPFGYEFFQRALLVATITGALCGLIGVYVVLRGMSYIGHGLSHAIFGGAVASYIVGVNVFLGAGLWGLVAALFINKVARRRSIGADAAIGAITSASFAIGIILISTQRTFVVNFEALLWGNVLGVTACRRARRAGRRDAARSCSCSFGYRQLLFSTFDPEVAEVSGVRTARVDVGLAVMLTATIAATMNVIGVTMIAAMLVIPPVIGRLLTDSLRPDALDLGRRGDGVRVPRRLRLVLPELVLRRHRRAGGGAPVRGGVRVQRLAPSAPRPRRRALAAVKRRSRAETGDREVREVGDEPVVALDEPLEPAGLLEGQLVVLTAVPAGQVDVVRLVRAVVLGPGLDVGVLEDADALEERERPIDGRCVHARHVALDLPRDRGGGDVSLRAHHLGDDRPPLRGHPEPTAPELGHQVGVGGVHARHRSSVLQVQRTASPRRAAGDRGVGPPRAGWSSIGRAGAAAHAEPAGSAAARRVR